MTGKSESNCAGHERFRKEVRTMSTKAKIGIALGTAALALAAYGGYRYWKRRRQAR